MATTTTSTFVPYITPPPGTVSNPIDPASLSYETHITIGISIGFVTLFFLARLYARAVIKKTWILEDCKFAAHSCILILEFLADISISIRACCDSMGEFPDSQEDVQGGHRSNSDLIHNAARHGSL